jgi:hypothetical protein
MGNKNVNIILEIDLEGRRPIKSYVIASSSDEEQLARRVLSNIYKSLQDSWLTLSDE